MVELTHGGAWLKWSTLSRTDRNWALLSFAGASLAAIPLAIVAGHWGYIAGYRLGSGGREPDRVTTSALVASDLFSYAMLAAAVLAVLSAFAWWRFSRNQDEMFNRIQNYAIAQAAGWTFAIALLWWLLELGSWVTPLPPAVFVAIGTWLLIGFWFHAVRRWL